MGARKPKPPANVVSPADYRKREEMAPQVTPILDTMKGARLIAEFATDLGIDLRLALAIQRGDVPPVA